MVCQPLRKVKCRHTHRNPATGCRGVGKKRYQRMVDRKNIALVAHDNCKVDMIAWARHNWQTLAEHHLTTTGTTGSLIENAISADGKKPVRLNKLKSGPLGGDLQLGALIAEGKIDAVFFFWDPMHAQPHDVDVKALLRVGVLYNVITACNRATADLVISSPLFSGVYARHRPDFGEYLNRTIF